MSTITIRNGIPYQNCTVVIPSEIREMAKDHGISMSGILTREIPKEVDRLRG